MTARRRTPAEKAADDAIVAAETQAREKDAERVRVAALRDLQKAVAARTKADDAAARAEDAVAGEISPARHGGATWPKIGAVLGLTKPGVAYNMYHRYDDSPTNRAIRDVDPAALKALEKAVAIRTRALEAAAKAEDAVTRAVIAARRAAVTWALIGEAVGMAQPNAVIKYKALVSSATLRERRHLT